MPRSSVKKPRERKDPPPYGLSDMFINRPGGDAGLIMSLVWGDSEADFGEIVMKELEDEQRRNPGKFVNKIAPKTPPKK